MLSLSHRDQSSTLGANLRIAPTQEVVDRQQLLKGHNRRMNRHGFMTKRHARNLHCRWLKRLKRPSIDNVKEWPTLPHCRMLPGSAVMCRSRAESYRRCRRRTAPLSIKSHLKSHPIFEAMMFLVLSSTPPLTRHSLVLPPSRLTHSAINPSRSPRYDVRS